MNISRRSFVKKGLITTTGIAASPTIFSSQKKTYIHSDVCVFSKCLQFLDFDNMAEIVSKMGFNGIDLTVREDGHVLLFNVENDLLKAVKATQSAGINIPMITTDITDADDPYTERILTAASSLGIKYYRLGRLKYQPSKNIVENLDEHKRTLDKIEKLNRKYNLHGCIQNHSGPYNLVGAPVWDLYYLLKDFDPEFIGVQYDIMHATVEGGYSWPLGLKLVAPWIKTIDIKDFEWIKNKKDKWETRITPLAEGMVDFIKFTEMIKQIGLQATYSIHYEYNLGGAENGSLMPDMAHEKIYQEIKKDLVFFKKLNLTNK